MTFLNSLARTLMAASIVAAAPIAGAADAWPAKPITIINGYPAGGDSDVVARLYAEKLTAKLVRRPKRAEVPVICEVQLVVEYYAR